MTQPRQSRITGDGVALAVREWGDPDRPTVVLIHGYPDTSAMWIPVAEILAARFHVVAYDVRGAGLSGAPVATAGYRLDHLMGDLEAVIDALSPATPVHLVGHDWGSIQGWQAVSCGQFDGRIASFTSISGPPLDHLGSRPRRLRPRAALRQIRRSWYIYAFHLPGLAPLAWHVGGRAWPALVGRLEGVDTGPDWPAPTVAEDGARGVGLYRANIRDRLAHPRDRRTDVPVQLIVPRHDRYVTVDLLDGLGDVASCLRRREVAAGHWVARVDPAATAAWIAEHIADAR